MAKTLKPKYTGILAEPIKLRDPGLGLASNPEEIKRHNDEQFWQRVKALYEHYGVRSDDAAADFKVLLRLAIDHVPGFAIAGRPKGRPEKWGSVKSIELFADVKAIMKRRGISARSACSILINRPRYRGQKLNSLYRRFMEAQKTIPKNEEYINHIVERLADYAENVIK